jgi:hypothetical protein
MLCGLALLSSEARADAAEPAVVGLEWTAAESCPTTVEFAAIVREKSGGVVLVIDPAIETQVAIELSAAPSWVGPLVVARCPRRGSYTVRAIERSRTRSPYWPESCSVSRLMGLIGEP